MKEAVGNSSFIVLCRRKGFLTSQAMDPFPQLYLKEPFKKKEVCFYRGNVNHCFPWTEESSAKRR